NSSAPGTRFRLVCVRPGLDAPRTIASFPSALVAAPVGVFRTQPATPYPYGRLVEVYIEPFQTERFALAETKGESDGPSGAIATPAYCAKQPLNFLYGIGLDFFIREAGRLHEDCRIPREMPRRTASLSAARRVR